MSSVDKTIEEGKMQGVGCGGGLGASAPTGQKHLIPFKLRIHDDDPTHPHGKELGTVWVEIPHDEIVKRVKPDIPGQHWEYVAQEEKYAAESICADLSCSIDVDALHTSPQHRGEPRRVAPLALAIC